MSGGGDHFVLTISCPDTTGIVAAVAGLLADEGLFITELSHFGDPETRQLFMRTAFQPARDEVFSRSRLDDEFKTVAERFGMNWSINSAGIPTSCLILVSKHDHCLHDLLYRYRTGTLNMSFR